MSNSTQVAAARVPWWRKRGFAIGAVLPVIIILLAITIFPLVYSLFFSLYDYYLPRPHQSYFVGGQNYLSVLQDARFRTSLKQTGILMASSISIEFFLALIIAMLFFGETRVKKYLLPVVLLPMMIAPVIVGYMWRLLYQVQNGPINYLLLWIFSLGPYEWTSSASLLMCCTLNRKCLSVSKITSTPKRKQVERCSNFFRVEYR